MTGLPSHKKVVGKRTPFFLRDSRLVPRAWDFLLSGSSCIFLQVGFWGRGLELPNRGRTSKQKWCTSVVEGVSWMLGSAVTNLNAWLRCLRHCKCFWPSLLPLRSCAYYVITCSNGVYMTKEDYQFYLDSDCSTAEHTVTRMSLHDLTVDYANNFANGETDSFLSMGTLDAFEAGAGGACDKQRAE